MTDTCVLPGVFWTFFLVILFNLINLESTRIIFIIVKRFKMDSSSLDVSGPFPLVPQVSTSPENDVCPVDRR